MIRTCHLSFPGRQGPLAFDCFESSERHVAAILNGTTYPEIPDIGPVETVVDVGANVGAASVVFAARYATATIHAFEPGPVPRAVLERNVLPVGRIRVYPYGLHDHDATVRLYRSFWDPMSASIQSSTENGAEFDEIVLRNAAAVLDAEGIHSIDVLKIDTEGCEVPILTSFGERARKARLIYLEYHSEADRRWIDQMLGPSHVLAAGTVRHAHRGDLCYVANSVPFAERMAEHAIQRQADGNQAGTGPTGKVCEPDEKSSLGRL
jgi:FkbM family methyltransferase